tara:strand:- start:572 stop:757 length:186 start_codon:yes stop_codon:yes gene_type:complete
VGAIAPLCIFLAWGAAPGARQTIPQPSSATLRAGREVPPDLTLAPPDFASRSEAQAQRLRF